MRRVLVPIRHLPRYKRPVRLVGLLCVILAMLIAAASLGCFWSKLAGRLEPAGSKVPGAVLMVYFPGQSAGQYRLLQTSLAAIGYPGKTLYLSDQTAADLQQVQTARNQLARESGCEPEQVWLAAFGSGVPAAWRLGSQLQVYGQILIMPQGLAGLDTKTLQQWPADKPVAILSVQSSSVNDADSSRTFFERLSGEDATLFPELQKQKILQSSQYLSATGKIWLSMYPVLIPAAALLSPRVLTDITHWLSFWPAGGDNSSSRLLAGQLIIDLTACIFLGCLMLLIIPLGMILLLDRKVDESAAAGSPDFREAFWPELLALLPAAALACGLGWLLAWLAGQPDRFWLPGLALLPGCRGYVLLLVRLRKKHQRNKKSKDSSESDAKIAAAPNYARASRILGIAPLIAVLVFAWVWSGLAFGTIRPALWFWLALPVLSVFNWSAGMTGTVGRIGLYANAGLSAIFPWQAAIWQHLPFLVLPVWASIAFGWPGLLASLLLLIVHFWSISLGKAAVLLLGHPGIGSLFQSIGFASAFLLLPVLH